MIFCDIPFLFITNAAKVFIKISFICLQFEWLEEIALLFIFFHTLYIQIQFHFLPVYLVIPLDP